MEKFPCCLRYPDHPGGWHHRLRITNLAEGFFMHLRTCLRRFAGFNGTHHAERIMGIVLLAPGPPNPDNTSSRCAQHTTLNNVR
jgi:hypothetical protein